MRKAILVVNSSSISLQFADYATGSERSVMCRREVECMLDHSRYLPRPARARRWRVATAARDGSSVCATPTNEQLMIAQHALSMLGLC